MRLAEFDRRLREIAPAKGWPFVCKGSPLGCSVFLLGINPRSDTPFWPHWHLPYGFDKSAWLDAYRCREGRLSRTRKQLERLVETLEPIRCLETNVFAASSPRLAELSREARTTYVFDFLLEAIRPRLLLVHGRAARRHVERRAGGVALTLNEFRTVDLGSGTFEVLASHHLSYQLSAEGCRKLGERIRNRVASGA